MTTVFELIVRTLDPIDLADIKTSNNDMYETEYPPAETREASERMPDDSAAWSAALQGDRPTERDAAVARPIREDA